MILWLLWGWLSLLSWDWSGWLNWQDLLWCLVGDGVLDVVWGISWVWSLWLLLNWLWLGLVGAWGSSISFLSVLVLAAVWAFWLVTLWSLLLWSLGCFIFLSFSSWSTWNLP